MEENIDDGVIRCICGSSDDDGYTVQCEKCYVWQHVKCVITKGMPIPECYLCEKCDPKQQVDLKKSKPISIKKQNNKKKDIVIPLPHNVGRPPKVHSSRKEPRSSHPSSQAGSPPKKKTREFGHGRSKSQAKNNEGRSKNARQISPEMVERSSSKSINFQRIYDANANSYSVIKNNVFDNKDIQTFISSKINSCKLKNKSQKGDSFTFDIDVNRQSLIYVPKKLQKASVTVRPVPSRISIFDSEFSHYGLYAASNIPKNTFICDIKGSIKYFSNISNIHTFTYDDVENNEANLNKSTLNQQTTPNNNTNINNSTSNDNITTTNTNNTSEANGNTTNTNTNTMNANSINNEEANTNEGGDTNDKNNKKYIKKLCYILDPFIFTHPADELDSLVVDAREYGNDGRFVRFYCEGSGMEGYPNAALQSIICLEYNEKALNTNHSGIPGGSENIEKEKKYKLKLAIISTCDIKKGDEIVISTFSNKNNEKWIGFPCVCGDYKNDHQHSSHKDSDLSSTTLGTNCILDNLLNENSGKYYKRLNLFGNYNNKSFIIDENFNEWIQRVNKKQEEHNKRMKENAKIKSKTNQQSINDKTEKSNRENGKN